MLSGGSYEGAAWARPAIEEVHVHFLGVEIFTDKYKFAKLRLTIGPFASPLTIKNHMNSMQDELLFIAVYVENACTP